MKELKMIKIFTIISAIFALIAGVCFTIHPIYSGATIVYVVGVFVIVSGIMDIIMHFVGKDKVHKPSIFYGLLKIVLGIFAVRHLLEMELMLACVFSVYIVMGAISSIEASLKMKKAGISGWLAMMIISIICVIVGIGMIINPLSAVTTTAYFIGITMIVEAVMTIASVFVLNKAVQEIEKM